MGTTRKSRKTTTPLVVQNDPAASPAAAKIDAAELPADVRLATEDSDEPSSDTDAADLPLDIRTVAVDAGEPLFSTDVDDLRLEACTVPVGADEPSHETDSVEVQPDVRTVPVDAEEPSRDTEMPVRSGGDDSLNDDQPQEEPFAHSSPRDGAVTAKWSADVGVRTDEAEESALKADCTEPRVNGVGSAADGSATTQQPVDSSTPPSDETAPPDSDAPRSSDVAVRTSESFGDIDGSTVCDPIAPSSEDIKPQPSDDPTLPATAILITMEPSREQHADETARIRVDGIAPSPFQPRTSFDEKDEPFGALAVHIREYGLLHPIAVRVLPDGTFELIAGARRLHACRSLGHDTISAHLFYGLSDAAARAMTVAENLARQDLRPLEGARAMASLRDAFEADGRKADVRTLEVATGWSKSLIAEQLKVHDVVTDAMIALVRQTYGDEAADAVPRAPRTKLLRAARAGDVAVTARILAEPHHPLLVPSADADALRDDVADDDHGSKSVQRLDTPTTAAPRSPYKISWSVDAPLKVATTRPVRQLPPRDAYELYTALQLVMTALRERMNVDED